MRLLHKAGYLSQCESGTKNVESFTALIGHMGCMLDKTLGGLMLALLASALRAVWMVCPALRRCSWREGLTRVAVIGIEDNERNLRNKVVEVISLRGFCCNV